MIRNGFTASTLAFPCFDGVYLTKQENEFVHLVMEELETWLQKNNQKRVLLFPPLPSRLRYLIHRTVEELPQLVTFSIGESWCRRVVVCCSEIRGEVREDSNLESNNSLCEDLKENEDIKPQSSGVLRSKGPKRPDKPLYVPRAARERLPVQNSQSPLGACERSNAVPENSLTHCLISVATENTLATEQKSDSTFKDRIAEYVDNPSELHPDDTEDIWVEESCKISSLTLEDSEMENGYLSNVPYSSQTEDTNLDSEADDLTEEIKVHLKDGVAVSIVHVHNDYSSYESVPVNTDEFGHVIEIYNFPGQFKTDDLLDAFTDYSDGGLKIKWVDNTHALGIFSSEAAALHALSVCHPLLKARALAEGSKKAKSKAIKRAEFMQPVKERPRTDCAVARRMVTRALGLQRGGRVQRY